MPKLKRMTNLVVYNFLQWFVNEQVEEVATVEEIIHKLGMIGDNKGGLYTCLGSVITETDAG